MALLQTLIDSKKEYTNHLCDLITPFLVNVFFEIYNGLKSGSAQRNILQRFQAEISKIAEWNTEQIHQVYSKFTVKTKCTYLGSLVKELVLTSVKIHLKNHDIPLSDFKVQIRVPGGESFYHRVLVNAARAIWKQPFIFYHQVRTVEHQNNIIAIEKLIRDTIITTLRACIPMEEMMRITSMAQSSTSSHTSSESDSSSSASGSSESSDDASGSSENSSSASESNESSDDDSSSASESNESSDDDASSASGSDDDDSGTSKSGSDDDASSASGSSESSDDDASSASDASESSDDDASGASESSDDVISNVPIIHELQDALEARPDLQKAPEASEEPEALEAPEAPETSPEKKIIDYEPLSRLSQKKRPVADGTFF